MHVDAAGACVLCAREPLSPPALLWRPVMVVSACMACCCLMKGAALCSLSMLASSWQQWPHHKWRVYILQAAAWLGRVLVCVLGSTSLFFAGPGAEPLGSPEMNILRARELLCVFSLRDVTVRRFKSPPSRRIGMPVLPALLQPSLLSCLFEPKPSHNTSAQFDIHIDEGCKDMLLAPLPLLAQP